MKEKNSKNLINYQIKNPKLRLLFFLVFLIILVIITIGVFKFAKDGEFQVSTKKTAPENFLLASAQKIVNRCQNDFNWRDCYGEQMRLLNNSIDFPDTLQILEKVEEIDPKTRDCHLIAHWISGSEVEKDPDKWIEIFDYVDQTTCVNGFVHGVLEGRSKHDPTLILDTNTIPGICKQIEERTSARVGKMREGADDACAHIIGHILLAQENAVIKNAVDICDKIPKEIKVGCFDGVFMENITRENLEIHKVAKKFPLNKEASLTLEKVCQKYRSLAGRECWRELAHIYTIIGHNDPNQVFPLCYQSDNKDYAYECFMHSINLMILSDNYTEQNLADNCRFYWHSEKAAESCLSRSIFPLLASSIDFIDRATILCQSQPQEYKQFCYTKIGQELKNRASLDKRKQLCQAAPKEFYGICIAEN